MYFGCVLQAYRLCAVFDVLECTPPQAAYRANTRRESRETGHFPELSTNVPNSTYVCIVACQDAVSYQGRNAMPKSEVSRDARRRQRRRNGTELPDAVEGQIEEICHDLAVQVKRMRQLQEQAGELRTALREWAGADSLVRTD
jgi:hypothetical protein